MTSSSALIIPAAGVGKRMKHKIAKPYIQIQGKAILAHTIHRFLSVSGLRQIVIAASGNYLKKAQEILQQAIGNAIPWSIVEGGPTRQQSIHHAIKALADDIGLVMIHDAVRPFVTKGLIEKCCRQAKE